MNTSSVCKFSDVHGAENGRVFSFQPHCTALFLLNVLHGNKFIVNKVHFCFFFVVFFIFLQETTRIPSLKKNNKKTKQFLADASVEEHPVLSMQTGPSEPSLGPPQASKLFRLEEVLVKWIG